MSDKSWDGQQLRLKSGLFNGIFLGLALAMGAWAVGALRLAQISVPLQYSNLILGTLLLVAICGFSGWITSRWQNFSLNMLFWLATATLVALIIGYLPYYGRTLVVWLTDRRFWGWMIYAPPEGLRPSLIILAGFFILLLLSVLALLQNYRLEAICREINEKGHLLPLAWMLLLLPTPFAYIAGYVTSDISGDNSASAIQLVHRAIQRGRTYEGDLFQLGLDEGINYSAIRGVRDQMSATYVLSVSGIDAASSSTFVIAYFDNGAWIQCRVISDQLSFCADAALPYTTGFADLITGKAPAETCFGCQPTADDGWLTWLQARREQFAGPPVISRLSQRGSYVLMQAESASGDYVIQCWFHGLGPVHLESCKQING